MEEVQRIVGESGEAVAIRRDWNLKEEAVNWLLSQKGYVQLNGLDRSAADDADEYVMLLQVLRDLDSLRRACSAGKEEVVVARSLVEVQEDAEGGGGRDACELLASSGYIECPRREQRHLRDERVDGDQDDLRYYYRTKDCKLRLPANSDTDNDAVEKQPIEGHRGVEDESQEGWKACCSLVWDDSQVRGTQEQLSVSSVRDDGTTVKQTPIIRFQLDAWARAGEFHLDVKLQSTSLPSVSESKNDCTTQNTEIGVTLGMAPVQVSAKSSLGNSKTTTQKDHDAKDIIIEYWTEEGGVASAEWQMRRWGKNELYRSDRPYSPSWISSNKIPKLPFRGTTPPLQKFKPVSWRLPICALHDPQRNLTMKIRVCFDMCFIYLKERTVPILKLPKTKKLPLEREFEFVFQLPAALRRASDAAPS